MSIGGRLKQARLEAGLSQRQLCGDLITRNMLSQIENGSARPSMDTLANLASRLGKPVSFFLEEDAVLSANQAVMETARQAFQSGEAEAGLTALREYREPDPVFDWEYALLVAELSLQMAQQAIREGRLPYAVTLLEQAEQAGKQTPYYTELHQKRLLLCMAKARPDQIPRIGAEISADAELMIMAQAAMPADTQRAIAVLEAVKQKDAPNWFLLRGQAAVALGDWRRAAAWLHCAEESYPQDVIPLLERCYEALEDYKMAYLYACKQKK